MKSQILSNKTTFKSDYIGGEIANLLDKTFQIPEAYSAQVMLVTDAYEARPDVFCQDVYGDEDAQDVICKLNGISNPFEFAAGMYVIVPDADALQEFYCVPVLKEEMSIDKAPEEKRYKPTPKAATATRKPNEAVIGDRRFVIDRGSKVIIY